MYYYKTVIYMSTFQSGVQNLEYFALSLLPVK